MDMHWSKTQEYDESRWDPYQKKVRIIKVWPQTMEFHVFGTQENAILNVIEDTDSTFQWERPKAK